MCCDGTRYLHTSLYKLRFLRIEPINESNNKFQEKILINLGLLLY